MFLFRSHFKWRLCSVNNKNHHNKKIHLFHLYFIFKSNIGTAYTVIQHVMKGIKAHFMAWSNNSLWHWQHFILAGDFGHNCMLLNHEFGTRAFFDYATILGSKCNHYRKIQYNLLINILISILWVISSEIQSDGHHFFASSIVLCDWSIQHLLHILQLHIFMSAKLGRRSDL